jgi:phosphomannomutase
MGVLLLVLPFALRYLWRTEPLPPGPLRDRFEAYAKRIGLRATAPESRSNMRPGQNRHGLAEFGPKGEATEADIGFATDPDVDRLALVLDNGIAPGEDYTLALAARTVLRHRPGPVVTNLSTSKVVADVARDAGVPFHFAKVGEVNVALTMRELGATIGGEGNGGVILPELHLGRDAPVGAALLLQLMLEEARPLSAVIADRPRYVIVKDKLDRPDSPLDAVYVALQAAFPDAIADTQDGLRLDWPDRWVHLRPSGTEPIVRVIAEGPSEHDARTLILQAREPLSALASH